MKTNEHSYQNYLVKDGQAVPENPFHRPTATNWNIQSGSPTKSIIQYEASETWKQSHIYQTNAPDGSWPIERFDVVWQYRSEVQDWIDVSLVRYDEYTTFEAYSRESTKYYRLDTRQFAKFKEEVEKPFPETIEHVDAYEKIYGNPDVNFPIEEMLGDFKSRMEMAKEVEKPKESDATNEDYVSIEAVIKVIKYMCGYTDFPERKEGQGAYYWRSILRQKFEEIGVSFTDEDFVRAMHSKK